MYYYSWLLILLLLSCILDIFTFGLEKGTKTTKLAPIKHLVKKSNPKNNKPSSIHPTQHIKKSINKNLIIKPTILIKPTTKEISNKSITTNLLFNRPIKKEKSQQTFLLWSDVLFFTLEKKEPEEIFPIDEGFLIIAPKKPMTKMKTTLSKVLVPTTAVFKSLPTKVKVIPIKAVIKSLITKVNGNTTKLKTNAKILSHFPSSKKTFIAKKLTEQPTNKLNARKTTAKHLIAKHGQRHLLETQNPIEQTTYECKTNADCNHNNNEICILQDLRKECLCLPGYSRDNPEIRICHSVKTFKIIIWLNIIFNPIYNEYESLEYREMCAYLMQVLLPYLSKDDIKMRKYNQHFIKIVPSHFWMDSDSGSSLTIGDCYALFYKNNLQNKSLTALNVQTFLMNVTQDSKVIKFEIKDPNDCEDIELNYCSNNATCISNNGEHNSITTCKCKPGFKDISDEEFLPPGALCKDICYSDYCLNNGICYVGSDMKTKECKCSTWFVMSRCELDLKWLIPVVACCLIIILICTIFSIRIYCKGKKENKLPRPSETMKQSSPNRNDVLHVTPERVRPASPLYNDIPIGLGEDIHVQSSIDQQDDRYEFSGNFFPRAHM